MDLADGIRYDGHARFQMGERGVTGAQVEQALTDYHTAYPAEPLPHLSYRCAVYVAVVDGRTLKVYVENGTHPPMVRTVAWRDWS